MAGCPAQTSSSSGIFFQGDGHDLAIAKGQLSSPFGNSASSISGTGISSLGLGSGDMNLTANSGPSVGASSLVTDANSSLSGGPRLQRSASINTESYVRLPASPLSFSSNNLSISGSSIMDGSSVQQNCHHDQNSHQDQNSQHLHQQRQFAGSCATSQPTSRGGQMSQISGPNSLIQEPNDYSHIQKKPRIEIKQEDIMQQQVMQMMQRQDQIQLQGHSPQMQTLIPHQRLLQRHQQPQQILQSMPHIQQASLQQPQGPQLRQHIQQQSMQQVTGVKRPYENGVCARRLMQFIYHQRHRPPDNSIIYWRKFVTEYFAPRGKRRWCLSQYDNVGHHALGVFPQAAMDAWQCDICGCRSGRGFEATFEVLPRLTKMKFDGGVIDELLFVDMPRECRFPSGIMMLEYGKAVQESVYDQARVAREGQLRIIFTPDLKILTWEFCARRHEELIPRRVLAPQVAQVMQVAQKYQAAVAENKSNGISPQDLQATCNSFVAAWRQLAKTLELQSLNDLGFSKRYVRCLQISEVVSSMKDLIDFSREHKLGPIESLKNYPRQTSATKYQMQEMEQLANAQGLPTDINTLNKLMAMQSGLNNQMNNNNNHMVGNGTVLGNYQNMLRQNSINANSNMFQQEGSSSFGGSRQTQQSLPFQGPSSLNNVQVNNLLSQSHCQQQNNGNLSKQNYPQSTQGNQNSQQLMIQQLMREMMNSGGQGRVQQQHHENSNGNGNVNDNGFNAINGTISNCSFPVKPAGSTGSVGNLQRCGNTAASSGGRNIGRNDSFKETANSCNSLMVGDGGVTSNSMVGARGGGGGATSNSMARGGGGNANSNSPMVGGGASNSMAGGGGGNANSNSPMVGGGASNSVGGDGGNNFDTEGSDIHFNFPDMPDIPEDFSDWDKLV